MGVITIREMIERPSQTSEIGSNLANLAVLEIARTVLPKMARICDCHMGMGQYL